MRYNCPAFARLKMQTCYAHSLPGRPPAEWQTLDAHSSAVAALAESFADSFGSGRSGCMNTYAYRRY